MHGRSFSRPAGNGFGGAFTQSTLSFATPPPDLSAISDPNLIVSFKSLLKKSDATVVKGLEDIRTYVEVKDDAPEDAIIKAWSEMYPRLAINNSRRARELSHSIQMAILFSAGASIQPYLAQMVPTWLAGTFDNDKGVARAAAAGWEALVNTKEKKLALLKKSQPVILAYAQEGLGETPETLSDERTMSPDDLKATHSRLVGNCVDMVNYLMGIIGGDDRRKHIAKYEAFISSPDLLQFTSNDDVHLRRSSLRLLYTCVSLKLSIIEENLKAVSHAILSVALSSTQLGSALDLLKLVDVLTTSFPQMWMTEAVSKRSPLKRLRAFIEKGSQRGDSSYWSRLASLLAKLPGDILPPTTVTLIDMLSSVRIGIKNRDEPKSNLATAWTAYIEIAKSMITKRLSDPDAQVKLVQEALLPVIANFALSPSEKASRLSNELTRVESLLQFFSNLESGTLRDHCRDLVVEVLVKSAKKLEEDMFSAVDDEIIASRFSHWFQIVDCIFADSELRAYLGSNNFQEETILSITEKLIRASPQIVEGRQGLSYGAASGLAACMLSTGVAQERPALLDFVKTYIEKDMFGLLLTPSGEYLLSALNALRTSGRQDAFNRIWSTTIRKILELDPSEYQVRSVILVLLRGNGGELALENGLLQNFIGYHALEALEKEIGEESEPSWSVLSAAASSDSISATTFAQITNATIANFLQGGDDAAINRGLRALGYFSEKHDAFVLSSDDERAKLLTCLIRLSEDEMDSTDPREPTIQVLTRIVSNSDGTGSAASLLNVLQSEMTNLDRSALSIPALGNLARRILATNTEKIKPSTLEALLPTNEQFELISRFYEDGHHSSIGATEPFGSASFLLDSPSACGENVTNHSYDKNGHSGPLRIALFLSDLMEPTMLLSMTAENATKVLVYLCVVSQQVRAQTVCGNMKGLYNMSCGHVDNFVNEQQSLLWQIAENSASWRRNSKGDLSTHDTTSILDILVTTLLEQSRGTTFLAFYSGLALSNLLFTIVDSHGPNFQCTESRLEEMKVLPSTSRDFDTFDTPFATLAILTGIGKALQSSELVKKFCKTLIGKFRDFEMAPLGLNSMDRAYLNVCLLNGSLAVYGEDSIPSNTPQLVHAVMKMVSWIDGEDFSEKKFALASETCRALTKILPSLSQSNGTFWATALERLCLAPWALYGTSSPPEGSVQTPSESHLFVLCSWSVKLYARLVRLKVTDEEDTFSLKDAFTDDEMQIKLNHGLLGLLDHDHGDVSAITPHDRPVFSALYEVLRPEIYKIPIENIDLERIYPLINFSFPATQAIAFETIERALPGIIEDLTLKVALDKQDAELPAELQSLLLTEVLASRPTSSDGVYPISSDRTLLEQRSVLLVWNLVIQSFGLAPYQVKMGFIDNLQKLDVLDRFLEFVNIVFSTPDGKMKLLSLDKESLRSYDVLDLSHSGGLVHNVRWLTAVNYFLALKHMPYMVKGWYLETSRAVKAAMQAWTQANFTPIVLEDIMKEIRQWRDAEEGKDSSSDFDIKLPSKSGSTMTLSYQVDDQYCVVQFVFPESYPLESISVKSVNRVAVPERTWNGVIANISGAMRFKGGSIIDGIEVFKRNVSGFLEGHEACCICYSIISEDMKVPNKDCGTCHNSFHGKCLAQWFNTSNANTCPMCRQPMTGLGRR